MHRISTFEMGDFRPKHCIVICRMKIAIVGGGISGLASAYFLQKRDPLAEIEIFEKESHVGGRLGTQRISGSKIVDTGCQYLSIDDEKILAFLYDTLPKSAIRPLPGAILCLPEGWILESENRFIVSDGMQSWAERIAQSMPRVKIHLSSPVRKMADLWAQGFDTILVTCPGNEARALGSTHCGDYWPCLGLFFYWHNPAKDVLGYYAYRDLVFREGSIWLAHEGLKHQEPGLWTAQLSPQATETWKHLSDEALEDKIQEDLSNWLPLFSAGEKTIIQKKMWAQAFPAMAPDLSEQEAFEVQKGPQEGQRLYFLGDGYFGVGRVENALQSANALVEEMFRSPGAGPSTGPENEKKP